MYTQEKLKYKLPTVFIVSSGRSGTSLLSSILNYSQKIYIPYESDFIARAYPFFGDKNHLNKQDYQQIAKFFIQTSIPEGWGMSEEYLLSFLEKKCPQTLAEVNSVICEAFHNLEGTDNLLWGIKAPVLIASLECIIKVNKDAKIVHIIRDGRDVYLSYKSVHEKSKIKFGPKGLVANALYWVDGLRRIEEIQANTLNIHELRYEDMLTDAENELKKLCDFLAIEYTPEMHTNFHEQKQFIPDKFRNTIHVKSKGGLDPSNIYKYLNVMPKMKLFVFETLAYPYLTKYQYETHFHPIFLILGTPLRWITYFLARQLNNLRYSKRDYKVYKKVCNQL